MMETFLACCARASAHSDFYSQLERLTHQEIVWDGLAQQAESRDGVILAQQQQTVL
jgi:hypothetical protein